MFRTLILTSAALTLAACGGAEAPTVNTDSVKSMTEKAGAMMETKTKAVLIYADWCGSCKVLDPAVQKAQSLGKVPGLEFVTLDYTDKDADAFYAQAEEAGVGDAVRDYLDGTVKTGQLLLIDVDDAKVIKVVKKDMAAPAIFKAMKEAVTAS